MPRTPIELTDDDARSAIVGLRQALAEQFVTDEELDRALVPCISPVCNAPLLDAAERWLAENAEALASSNAYVDAHGLPLSTHSDQNLYRRAVIRLADKARAIEVDLDDL